MMHGHIVCYCKYIFVSVVFRNATVKPLSDYMASTGGWMTWSADVLLRQPAQWMFRTLLKQPVSWTYSKLFSDADDTDDFCRPKTAQQIVASLPDNQFVFIDLIKVHRICYKLLWFIGLFVLSLPSVLWRCWLGGRQGIRPVKNWVVRCWHGYLSGAMCRLAYGPADATATHCLLLQ